MSSSTAHAYCSCELCLAKEDRLTTLQQRAEAAEALLDAALRRVDVTVAERLHADLGRAVEAVKKIARIADLDGDQSEYAAKLAARLHLILGITKAALTPSDLSAGEEVARMREAAAAGLDLSMWAATIKWDHRERNTEAWLEGLKARIERVQGFAALSPHPPAPATAGTAGEGKG